MTWLWPSHRQAPSPVSLPSCSPGGGPTSPRPAWWRRSGRSHPGPPRYHWRGRVSQVLSVLVSCFVTPRLPSPPSSPLSLPCCSLKSFSPLNALAFKPAVCKGKWWALIGLDSHDTRYDMTWPLFPCLATVFCCNEARVTTWQQWAKTRLWVTHLSKNLFLAIDLLLLVPQYSSAMNMMNSSVDKDIPVLSHLSVQCTTWYREPSPLIHDWVHTCINMNYHQASLKNKDSPNLETRIISLWAAELWMGLIADLL